MVVCNMSADTSLLRYENSPSLSSAYVMFLVLCKPYYDKAG